MISHPKRMRVGVVYAVLIVLLAVAVWVTSMPVIAISAWKHWGKSFSEKARPARATPFSICACRAC